MMVKTVLHDPFTCSGCRNPLNALTDVEVQIQNRGLKGDITCYTVCAYCKTVYSSTRSPADIVMGLRAQWTVLPNDQLTPELRAEVKKALKLGKQVIKPRPRQN